MIRIQWSRIYNNAAADGKSGDAVNTADQFLTRLCEFFVIDTAQTFTIWNLMRSMNKPAHSISFSDKCALEEDYRELTSVS